jgi:hypothetical protein
MITCVACKANVLNVPTMYYNVHQVSGMWEHMNVEMPSGDL